MSIAGTKRLRWIDKKNIFLLILLIAVARYSGSAIVTYSFPGSLLYLFIPFAFIVFLMCNMRVAIGIWYFASALGNNLEIDLPGIPPLRTVHFGLFLLLATWFVKSHGGFFSALIQFFNSTKNRILLMLIAWSAFSMVMGRLQGVTQYPIEYQFNAWLSLLVVILLAFIVSNNMDDRFVKKVVWLIVAFNTASVLFVIVVGLTKGVGLTEWKAFDQMERGTIVFWVHQLPLLLAMVFFREQRGFGKTIFSIAIIVSIVYFLLMIASGHRSSALGLINILAFFLLFTKRKWFIIFILFVVLPFVVWNISPIQSWVSKQAERTAFSSMLGSGKESRTILIEDAIEIIKRYPLWGTGYDYYRLHCDVKIMSPSGIVMPAATPHNSWLQVAADSGIPALLLLVAFCGYTLRDAWRLFHSSPNGLPQRYALFFLCTLCVAIVGSFISSGQIVPLFTGEEGGEAGLVAGVLLNFWFYYGLLLGFEKRYSGRTHTEGLGVPQ